MFEGRPPQRLRSRLVSDLLDAAISQEGEKVCLADPDRSTSASEAVVGELAVLDKLIDAGPADAQTLGSFGDSQQYREASC